MSKLDFKGTEFDSFFTKKDDTNQQKFQSQKNRKTEKQNPVITEKQENVKSSLTTVITKKDDPNYVRVTTEIKKSTMKIIKDYMWENNIKTFAEGLELFLSDKPTNQ